MEIRHHKDNKMAIVREDYYLLTGKDTIAAALLNAFEYWANNEIKLNPELAMAKTVFLGSRSIGAFKQILLGLAGEKQIGLRLKKLAAMGFIQVQGKAVDGTPKSYRFMSKAVQTALNNLGQLTDPPLSNNADPSVKLPTPLGQLTDLPRSIDRSSIYKKDLKNKEEEYLCAISGEIAPRQTSVAPQVSDSERETVSVEAGEPHAQEQQIEKPEGNNQVSGTKKQKRKKRSAAAIYAETVEKERFDKFWDSYTAFCKKYDARPGSKALAAEAWTDLISSGTPLDELRSGVVAYFKQIKQMKHAYGIPHACNFLAGSKVHPEPYWREALEMDQPKADLRGNEFEDQTKANGQEADVTVENSEQVFDHLKSLAEAKQIMNYRTEGDGSVRVQILGGRWRSCRDVLQMFPIEAEAKKPPYTNRALEPTAA